jgi:SAM-dependent MidA family methyltransferase
MVGRPLADRLAERIRATGPMAFEAWVEACLYDPDGGFYAAGGSAGRRGDFLTSPEVGPLFGAVVARWLDDRWEALGRPSGFTVVEAAAGVGTLARGVRAARPACLEAGRYVMVERCAVLRDAQPTGDGLESTASLGEVSAPGGDGLVGVVVANELLDNLAFGLLEAVDGDWCEVLVDLDPDVVADGADQPTFREVTGVAVRPPVDVAPMHGARIPVQAGAGQWVDDALGLLSAGSVLVVDYASTTAALAARPFGEWVRTYRGHQRGRPAGSAPGAQDVTVEVAVDQLPPGATNAATQAAFLRANGIDELVAEGRRRWAERVGIGDLDALRARSRITEAEALLDPDGLGGFTVLEWRVGS